jgi:sporulation protein YlmC with PRC-barrel domain
MAIRFQQFKSAGIEAKDGSIGRISDVLFDETTWNVRYVVVDTARWLPGRKVLLAPASFSARGEGLTHDGNLKVDLTKDQIKESPPLESDLPVSRRHESMLHSYFGWEPYWMQPYGMIGFPYPDAILAGGPAGALHNEEWALLAARRNESFDDHLHSMSEIIGYRIKTRDEEKFGEVIDSIIETKDWLIIDLILASHRWLPGGKEFVCSPLFVEEVSVTEKSLAICQTKELLLESPEFDFNTYGEYYRKLLVDHYRTGGKRKRQPTRPSSSSTPIDSHL